MDIIDKTKKQKKNFAGIYAIRNIKKEKYYIGSSKDVISRINTHIKELEEQRFNKKCILGDVDDINDLEFIILERLEDLSMLESKEAYYCGFYKSIENGYNKMFPKRKRDFNKTMYYKRLYEVEELKNNIFEIIISNFFKINYNFDVEESIEKIIEEIKNKVDESI